MEYTDQKIGYAVEKWISTMSREALLDYFYELQMDYFLHNADSDEIDLLMQEYGE
jgi:hypothetical protein